MKKLTLISNTKPSKPQTKIAAWLENPDLWDRAEFVSSTTELVMRMNGACPMAYAVLIAAMAHQVDIYVKCLKDIRINGLTIAYNRGTATGSNPHIRIGDGALSRIIQLAKELKLSPKESDGFVFQGSNKFTALLAGPAGFKREPRELK